MAHLKVGDQLVVDGRPGAIVACVRADDDPRKCVPPGSRLRLSRDPPERDGWTYLVHPAGTPAGRVVWTHGKSISRTH